MRVNSFVPQQVTAAPHRRPDAAELCGLILVLGLATWLRLGWPAYYNFGYDEARVSLLALQMARSGELAVTGMTSSTGLPNMPGLVWLMALPFAISPDPLLATQCVALANVLAVAGIWCLARRTWGPLAAFCSALLLACSPWAVFYSRGIWGQDLLIPQTVLWLLLMERAGRPPRKYPRPSRLGEWSRRQAPDIAMAGAVLAAGFAPQLHYAGFVLIPATLVAVIILCLGSRWKGILAGALLAGLAALPFGLALLRGNVSALAGRLASGGMQVDLTALQDLQHLILGQQWEKLLLNGNWVWPPRMQSWLRAGRVITGLMVLGGLAALVWLACRRDAADSHLARLSLVLLAIAPLCFIVHSTEVYIQYLLPALPGAFLSVGALAALLVERRPTVTGGRHGASAHVPGIIIAGLVMMTAGGQAAALAVAIRTMGEQALPGGLGTPLGYPRSAARLLKEQAAAAGEEMIVYTPGDNPAFIADAAIWEVLLWGSSHRIADGNAVLLWPASGQAWMLAVFPDLPTMVQARADGLVAEERELPRRQGEPPYLAWRANVAAQGYTPASGETLANGAQLLGWKVTAASSGLHLSVMWRLTAGYDGKDYHQFNHLYAADGAIRLDVQDHALSSQAWHAGDILITWADFALPEGQRQVWFEIGMYSYPDLLRSERLGAADPHAAIRLGSVDISNH